MKKISRKIVAIATCVLIVAACVGCSASENSDAVSERASESLDETADVEEETIPDLTGTWVQADADNDSWQEAVIEGDTITVYWVSDGGDTKSLYWAGTYEAPTEATDTYTWTSENDTEQTSVALLASTADTKDFTYSDGELSYEVTALGTTTTVRLVLSE